MLAVRTTTASWVSRSRSVTQCGRSVGARARAAAATPPSPRAVPRAARRDLRAGRTVRATRDRHRRRQRGEHNRSRAACNTDGLMPKDTGLPRADAEYDFSRARRRRALARLSARLRRADDVDHILPFEEVVQALGRIGERRLGEQTDLARLDRRDRRPLARVRPRRSGRPRRACASAGSASTSRNVRGQAMPPIDVYRIGDMHFVKDGHHRVSVAHALGYRDINAYVTEVLTAGRGGPRDPPAGPAAEEPRAPLLRPRAAAAGGAQAHPPERRVDLRGPGRGGRGVGLQGDPGPRSSRCHAARWRRRGSARSTSRWSRCSTRRS